MKRSESEAFAKRVVHYYENAEHFNRLLTVKHFAEEGHRNTSIYRSISMSLFRISGRPITVSTKKVVNKVKRLLISETDVSIRKGCLRTGITKISFMRIKSKCGFKTYKSKYAPKYTEKQKKRAKIACRKLYRKSTNKVMIIDDETCYA